MSAFSKDIPIIFLSASNIKLNGVYYRINRKGERPFTLTKEMCRDFKSELKQPKVFKKFNCNLVGQKNLFPEALVMRIC